MKLWIEFIPAFDKGIKVPYVQIIVMNTKKLKPRFVVLHKCGHNNEDFYQWIWWQRAPISICITKHKKEIHDLFNIFVDDKKTNSGDPTF